MMRVIARFLVLALTLSLALVVPSGTASAVTPLSPTPKSSAVLGWPTVAKAYDDKTIKVVSQRTYRDNHTITIYADLKNRTKVWRQDVRAIVTFYNKSGKRIGDGLTYPEQLYVRPGGHMSMKYYWTRVPKGYHHHKFSFTSNKVKKKDRPASRMKFRIGKLSVDPDIGGLWVPVRVKNNNKKKVKHVAVYVTLYDKKGRILTTFTGFNYTKPSVLKPGQVGKIRVWFGSRYKRARQVNVMVEAGIRR